MPHPGVAPRSTAAVAAVAHEDGPLPRVADLIDQGYVQTTVGKHLGTIKAANLKQAHAELESGTTVGKLVLEGF